MSVSKVSIRSLHCFMLCASGSSFNGQTLEIFVPSAKAKSGFSLRPLTNFFGSNGPFQPFVGSSFNGQLLENFTPSTKSKSGFLLRPLQFFSELNGPFQPFVLHINGFLSSSNVKPSPITSCTTETETKACGSVAFTMFFSCTISFFATTIYSTS
ncbi:Uncharacterised protein [Listeria newyorkensis]|nr:Uncharacterised protein [Listeria newyorkensis]